MEVNLEESSAGSSFDGAGFRSLAGGRAEEKWGPRELKCSVFTDQLLQTTPRMMVGGLPRLGRVGSRRMAQ